MIATESARILLQADVPWSISYFILGPLAVIAAFIFYRLIVPGLLKWRDLKDEITVILTQYANYVVFITDTEGRHVPIDPMWEKVNQELRKLSGSVSTLQNVFLYRFWVKVGWLPNKERIDNIQGDLIGWSNSLYEKFPSYMHREVYMESLKKHIGLPNNFEDLKELQKLEMANARKN